MQIKRHRLELQVLGKQQGLGLNPLKENQSVKQTTTTKTIVITSIRPLALRKTTKRQKGILLFVFLSLLDFNFYSLNIQAMAIIEMLQTYNRI